MKIQLSGAAITKQINTMIQRLAYALIVIYYKYLSFLHIVYLSLVVAL